MFKQIKQPMGYEPGAITPKSYYSQVSNRRAGWNKRKGWNIRDGWYWPTNKRVGLIFFVYYMPSRVKKNLKTIIGAAHLLNN